MCSMWEDVFTEEQFKKTYDKTYLRKPHECVECEKTFSQESHFKSQMITHTAQKPHECVECGKIFSMKSYLKNVEKECACENMLSDQSQGQFKTTHKLELTITGTGEKICMLNVGRYFHRRVSCDR